MSTLDASRARSLIILQAFFFFSFFLFFCGSGRSLCDRPSEEGRCPIAWHDLFSRTLPTITRRTLV